MGINHLYTTDNTTIVAPATPAATSAIAIMRISGPQAINIANKLWKGKPLTKVPSHTAHLGTITDNNNNPLDQAVATIYRAPHSFTGEDSVEIATHGSPYIQRQLLDALIKQGASLAEPGQFTRRAFINGKLDLTQAEAVADIIAADSKAAHNIAFQQLNGKFANKIKQLRNDLVEIASLLELELDFAEEDVNFASRNHLSALAQQVHDEIEKLHNSFSAGNAITHGIPVAIAGPANAGKSSLLNTILGHDRAIVSPIEGTTRDTIEETIHIGDHLFRFIDTAGLRNTSDPIEQIGIDRTHTAISNARIILYINDATKPNSTHTNPTHLPPDTTTIQIRNKADLLPSIPSPSSQTHPDNPVYISALTGYGIDTLRNRLADIATDLSSASGDILVANARHDTALTYALQAIERVTDGLNRSIPADLIAQSLRETIAHLSAITGDIPSTEILATIFSRFCIGK